MRKDIIAIILLFLFIPASAVTEGKLISCEYSIYGGMENEQMTYLLKQGESWRDVQLTVNDGRDSREYSIPWDALEDLADYMAAREPAAWASLPDREEFALDAPSRMIELTYDDGKVYTLHNHQETGSPIFRETEMFLTSYLVTDAETFELSFSSFDGGGPEYRAVLSDPEKVRTENRKVYDEPYDEMATGAGYDVILTFYGRVPGRTELRIEMNSPLEPPYEGPETVYVLEVDEDFNVRLAEEKQEEPSS